MGTKTINKPDTTILPLPPTAEEKDKFEMEIYARFMRHLRCVPSSRMDLKVLSSIQFTADMMDCNDALVAKTLVDLGLRAPRRAYPASYLDFTDGVLMRAGWNGDSISGSVRALCDHWGMLGEDVMFIGAQRTEYALDPEDMYITV